MTTTKIPQPNFHKGCLQQIFLDLGNGDWWQRVPISQAKRGHLLHAWVPKHSSSYQALQLIGRTTATEHRSFEITLVDRIYSQNPPDRPDPPVAAFSIDKNEMLVVRSHKKRPVLVLAEEMAGPFPQKGGGDGSSPDFFKRSIIVAPYYGTTPKEDEGEKKGRLGLTPRFERELMRCSYPSMMYDFLPIDGGEPSALRLERVMSLPNTHNAFRHYGYGLTPQALFVLDHWLDWYGTRGERQGKTCEFCSAPIGILKDLIELTRENLPPL